MEMTLRNKKRGSIEPLFSGWEVGFEPTTHGTTIRYSNQLSYTHHLICDCKSTTFFENATIFEEKNHFKMIFYKKRNLINYKKLIFNILY